MCEPKASVIICLMAFSTSAVALRAQEAIVPLQPVLESTPDLSPGLFALYAWYDSVLTVQVELQDDKRALYDPLYYTWGETYLGPCDILGLGCSWYCGGGPDSVWASSTLEPTKGHSYGPQHAHDLDHCTAWCEGVDGAGIGESLTYHFAKDSPRLHTIKISNGLVTNEASWRANNRVKRLGVSENGVPRAELNLVDTMGDQHFKLPWLLGKRTDGEPMILTFTILEVYRGDRYNDTVITEIWFDGIDVH